MSFRCSPTFLERSYQIRSQATTRRTTLGIARHQCENKIATAVINPDNPVSILLTGLRFIGSSFPAAYVVAKANRSANLHVSSTIGTTGKESVNNHTLQYNKLHGFRRFKTSRKIRIEIFYYFKKK